MALMLSFYKTTSMALMLSFYKTTSRALMLSFHKTTVQRYLTDMRQVEGFLLVLRYPSPINLAVTI
jgi:hypothetical protein